MPSQNSQSSQNTNSENEKKETLAKIYMLDTKNRSSKPVEWDGEKPREGYVLFVYARLGDSTYSSYTHYDSLKQKRIREFNKDSMSERWGKYYESYECMRPPPFQASLPPHTSLLHNERAHTEKPHLATILPNFMSGNMSYENSLDLYNRCRIYMFYPPSTQGLIMSGHSTVEPVKHTFWYKLDTSYNKDKEIEFNRHMRIVIPADSIRHISKKELTDYYNPHSQFIPPNFPLHIFGSEIGKLQNFKILKAKRSGTTKKLEGGKNNRKLIKKKINKRKKTKKTKKTKKIRRRK